MTILTNIPLGRVHKWEITTNDKRSTELKSKDNGNNNNKLIVYGNTFDSTKGYPGEGPNTMILTNRFFQCPTIMGKHMIKANMNKKKAERIIKQLRILQTNIYTNPNAKTNANINTNDMAITNTNISNTKTSTHSTANTNTNTKTKTKTNTKSSTNTKTNTNLMQFIQVILVMSLSLIHI